MTRAASRTARERARAELTREIKAEARRQLAIHGAQQLSLRAVARELGMASSAIYRYYPSRDELLTALIIDAYDSLGASTEAAERALARGDIRGRWRTACGAVRNWALANPHEYALIYGSPVPGYQAPQATIAPAGRVALVIGEVLADAWHGAQDSPAPSTATSQATAARPVTGQLDTGQTGSSQLVSDWQATRRPTTGQAATGQAATGQAPMARPARPLPPVLAEQAGFVATAIAPGVPPTMITRALIAWTQLFGMVSFELFRQLKGTVDPADDFFTYTVELMADFIGLT